MGGVHIIDLAGHPVITQFLGQIVHADIRKEIIEDVAESKEVEKLRAVFLVGSGDLLPLYPATPLIGPELIKQLQICLAFWCVHLL